MKIGLAFIFFLLLINDILNASVSLQTLYPNRLLTDSYGIVNDKDLAYDDSRRVSIPYNPNKFSSALYWQCFPIKDVKLKYRTWRDNDSMDAWNIIKTMCDLNYIVIHDSETQIYSGRRAYPVSYCRAIVKDWKRVTHGQKIVCLDGEGGEYDYNKNGPKTKSWIWDKVKTKSGCYSYFDGECLNIIEKPNKS